MGEEEEKTVNDAVDQLVTDVFDDLTETMYQIGIIGFTLLMCGIGWAVLQLF
jgi:hypothetical protein